MCPRVFAKVLEGQRLHSGYILARMAWPEDATDHRPDHSTGVPLGPDTLYMAIISRLIREKMLKLQQKPRAI